MAVPRRLILRYRYRGIN